jgi:aminoglycoside 2'-N-acetyltransferase I
METELTMETLPTRQLEDAVRREIVALCSSAFDEDFGRLFDLVPPGAWHVLARQEGRLVGHATWSERWLELQGLGLLRTAYVDAVATASELQGRGIGSRILQRLAEAVREDYDIGGLSTYRPGFYTRLGWQRWRGPLFVRTEQGLVPTPEEQGVMVLRLPRTPAELDLDLPLSIESRAGEPW